MCQEEKGLFKKFVQQGRRTFGARSVHGVRERERRKERKFVNPKVSQRTENAAGGLFQQSLH